MRYVGFGALLIGALLLGSCASSHRASCDPEKETCDETPDASVIADASPDTPDGPPLHGFGEPCVGNAQCESNMCLVVPTGGVCTATCGTCPDGWGCFGVIDVFEPGVVVNVCVPVTSQLCTQCALDSECAQIGMDKCVTEATGRSYCARDCSQVSCPSGYDCADVPIGGTTYHECMPHSGACDCNVATQTGATDACTITTALNTMCAGTSTCAGTAGWGACQPPSATDDPDATYTDNNCDGTDGDITKAIFVAGGGTNASTCGLTFSTPCQTISFGVIRAVQAGKQHVFVQAGTYNEVLVLQSGINVWGGFDFNWQRGPYTNAAHRVTIAGKQDTGIGGDGEWLAVRAHDLIVGVTIGDVVIQGPNASGTGGASGRDGMSSYAVHARGADVTLTRVQIVAGSGAPGGTGTGGVDAVTVDAQGFMTGGTGGNGDQFTTVCNSSSRGGGGGAASNSCPASPSSRSMTGGSGGQGGTMDTDCGVFSSNFNARGGDNGTNALFISGSFGIHGNGGSGGGSCGPTTNGNPGLTANGGPGGGANGGGYLTGASTSYWYAYAGGGGTTGENGTGGGGGGGSGGCDNGTDAYGAGGGGGGAGGCAARGGGTGGGGGGGSFGVFAVGNSVISLDACELFRGSGGGGGAGGTGGRGQSGGGAGPGGPAHPNSATPGNGGAGAHGGHGGGGGGGQGGRSIGVLTTPGTTINGSCTTAQGTSGPGGAGGLSAPNAPQSERDGNNGGPGGAGTVETTRQCAGLTSC
jgi:hypothetical protein